MRKGFSWTCFRFCRPLPRLTRAAAAAAGADAGCDRDDECAAAAPKQDDIALKRFSTSGGSCVMEGSSSLRYIRLSFTGMHVWNLQPLRDCGIRSLADRIKDLELLLQYIIKSDDSAQAGEQVFGQRYSKTISGSRQSSDDSEETSSDDSDENLQPTTSNSFDLGKVTTNMRKLN